jgi:hypothetical protein
VLKPIGAHLGDKARALPNLGHAAGVFRLDLRNGVFVAIRLEPLAAAKVTDTVQAIMAVAF